jgi:hypothetical protein
MAQRRHWPPRLVQSLSRSTCESWGSHGGDVPPSSLVHARFEVSTAVTMKNGVFWNVTPCGSSKNRHFIET